MICSLRQFLEQRGKGKHCSWTTSLPLALWGSNDLPGVLHAYSKQLLVLGREPIGWGEGPLYVAEKSCEDEGTFPRPVVQEKDAVRDKLGDNHEGPYRTFLQEHPPQYFTL